MRAKKLQFMIEVKEEGKVTGFLTQEQFEKAVEMPFSSSIHEEIKKFNSLNKTQVSLKCFLDGRVWESLK